MGKVLSTFSRTILRSKWPLVPFILAFTFSHFHSLSYFRDYYGVKMAFYFAWLGYYTVMLIPPSLVGFVSLCRNNDYICYPGGTFLPDVWLGHCLNRCHIHVEHHPIPTSKSSSECFLSRLTISSEKGDLHG